MKNISLTDISDTVVYQVMGRTLSDPDLLAHAMAAHVSAEENLNSLEGIRAFLVATLRTIQINPELYALVEPGEWNPTDANF